MKKISTAGARQRRDFREQKLTIGLDLGIDRAVITCCWNKAEHDSESDERSVWEEAAQPDRVGDGNAFTVGEPGVERVGTGSDSRVPVALDLNIIGTHCFSKR